MRSLQFLANRKIEEGKEKKNKRSDLEKKEKVTEERGRETKIFLPDDVKKEEELPVV